MLVHSLACLLVCVRSVTVLVRSLLEVYRNEQTCSELGHFVDDASLISDYCNFVILCILVC